MALMSPPSGRAIRIPVFTNVVLIAAVLAMALGFLTPATQAQSNDKALFAPFMQFGGNGGVYGGGTGVNFFQANGADKGCFDDTKNPTFGVPSEAAPDANYPTSGCDDQGGFLARRQTLTAGVDTPPGWTMTGHTAEVATPYGVAAEATIDSLGPNNGGLLDSFASYYQQNVQADVEPGETEGFSFLANVIGVGSGTAVGVCVYSDNNQACGDAVGNSPFQVIDLKLLIGPSGRYTISMSARTLTETLGESADATLNLVATTDVEKLEQFERLDPSDLGKDTIVRGEDDFGHEVGSFVASNGDTEAFEFEPNGSVKPIVPPLSNAGFSVATGINDAGTIVGAFTENEGAGVTRYRGFKLEDGDFRAYDEGPDVGSTIFGINRKGDFVGTSFGYNGNTQPVEGYFQRASGGPPVTITMPEASGTYAEGVNQSDDVIGTWIDTNNTYHGFLAQSAGVPISFDVPGATSTTPFSINDAGVETGQMTDSSGATHGFLGSLGRFIRLDLNGATATGATTLNNDGIVVGQYLDQQKIQHGFRAQVCASNVSKSVKVGLSRYIRDPSTGEFTQSIEVTNVGKEPIAGPLLVLLENLPKGVLVDNGNVASVCVAPGSPYITATQAGEQLRPGAHVSAKVKFANLLGETISHNTVVLAGPLAP
jgi:hypothetical protein